MSWLLLAQACQLLREARRSGLDWRAVVSVRQCRSDINSFSDAQRIFHLNAQITYNAIDLGVAQQKLHGAKVARLAVNFRSFGAAHRVCTVSAGFQTYRGHPVTHKSIILTC